MGKNRFKANSTIGLIALIVSAVVTAYMEKRKK